MAKLGLGVAALAGLTGLLQAAPQGPVGYWKLDETAAPSMNSAGTYGQGAWNGPAFSNAPTTANTYANTGCLYFDGSTDHVQIANSPELENVQENDYTLSAWARPEDVPAAGTNEGRYGILYKAGWHLGIGYNREGSGQGRFVFEHWLTGNVWEGVTAGVDSPPAQWYHVAAVVDRNVGISRIYVNGTPRGSNTWTGGTAAREYGTNPWRIGCPNPGANYGGYRWAYKGLIDDVRIYNRAFSDTEILILSNGVPTPVNVQATPGIQQVTLTWDPPAVPAGYSNYTYNVHRSVNGGAFMPVATGVSGTSYTDTGAVNYGQGDLYAYQVSAVSVAESGPSTPVATAVPLMPTPRTNDHDEGLFDDRCACGSSIPGAPGAALAAALVLAALLRRR